VHNKTVKQCL